MLKDYFRQYEEGEVHHLSTAELRQRAAAILRSGRGQDGIQEVTEILNIIKARYQQGKRRDDNVRDLPDARTPQR